MDLDFFKKVNDRYGHEAGDTVLIHLAKTVKNQVRATDYVIRWGGEEFLVLMPGCPVEQAVRIAEKIRETIQDSDSGVCNITVSIGVAEYAGGDYHQLIKDADGAMYKAKSNGRNRVVKAD